MALSTPSKAFLLGLSPELIELIAESLDLTTLCSFRLACKTLSERSSGPHFLSFFSHQKTDLTSRSLQRIGNIARHPSIGVAVRSLVVLAVTYDTSWFNRMLERQRRRVVDELYGTATEPQAERDDLDEAQRVREQLSAQQAEQESMTQNGSDVQLLADALRLFGKLPRLTVEAIIDQGSGKHVAAAPQGDFHRVGVRATQVYRTVTLAIAHSGAVIQSLQIYKDSKSSGMSTWDINEHMPALESTTFVQAAEHIKSLSLSFSTRVETNHQKIADARAKTSAVDHVYRSDKEAGRGMGHLSDLLSESDPSAVAAEDYPGIARLLRQTPNLEHLELHQRGTPCGNAKTYARVVSCIFDNVVLPSLRHCTLRIPWSDEASLVKFLRLHKALDTLELLHSGLVSGSWNPVFSQLCDMPSLQQVTLSNIRTPGKYGTMNFTSPLHSKEERYAMISGDKNSDLHMGGVKVHTRVISRDQMLRERFVFEDWACPFPGLDARYT